MTETSYLKKQSVTMFLKYYLLLVSILYTHGVRKS